MLTNQSINWQDILWREWRNCGQALYAKQLYELVADYPVGWGTKLAYIILEAIIGFVFGVLLAFVMTNNGAILQQFGVAGGCVGIFRGILATRNLTWRDWLDRLSFGLPSQQPSRGIAALVGLMLVGGMIFGPFLWLFLVGFFWGMSGLIKWMMRGLSAPQPFAYHAWYIWWRRRPSVGQVEAALQVARQVEKPPLPADDPLRLLLAAPPVEVDFLELETFARHRDEPSRSTETHK